MPEFQFLNVWSKFQRKVIVLYYTDSQACSNERGETEYSVQDMEASWKLKARAMSHFTHLA